MYKLGRKSIRKLSTCHKDLQLIIKEALRLSDIDFGVSDGFRSIKRQNRYFRDGKSNIDGIKRKGKHNYYPSLAVDIYPYIKGRALWDNEHLTYLSGIIQTVAKSLYEQGRVSHLVRWGGNWDMDGTILLDQTFDDRPHFELIKHKK